MVNRPIKHSHVGVLMLEYSGSTFVVSCYALNIKIVLIHFSQLKLIILSASQARLGCLCIKPFSRE